MKVYCGECKHYSEGTYVSDRVYEWQECAIAGEMEMTIPGNYRDAPYTKMVVIKPFVKNKNNDCKDWEAR